MLKVKDTKILAVTLEGIENILRVGKQHFLEVRFIINNQGDFLTYFYYRMEKIYLL